MELQDFLKVTKVRCVKNDGAKSLTLGETYEIFGFKNNYLTVVDDDRDEYCYDSSRFEPVLDDMSKSDTEIDTSADSVDAPHVSSPSNNDAPHVSERPSFKAGQKAYCPWLNEGKLVLLCSYDENLICADTLKGEQVFNKDGISIDVSSPAQPDLFRATQENYELLSKLMPWVDYEAPPKPLTGSDLCRAMLDKGWKYVPCYVSYDSDDDALSENIVALISSYSENRYVDDEYFWKHAVPFDPKTGEPLTEAVLNN